MNFRKLIAAGVVSLAIVVAFILTWPTFNNIGLLRTTIQERQLTLQKRQSLVNKVKQWQVWQKEAQPKIDKLGTLLPSQSANEEILVALEQIAQQAGLVMQKVEISNGDINNVADYQNLLVTVVSSGQYTNFREWLALLEKNLRIFDVQEYVIGKDLASNNLNFTIKFDSYYLKK